MECVGTAVTPLCQFRLTFETCSNKVHKNQDQRFWTYPHCQFAKHEEQHNDPLPGHSLSKSILGHLIVTFQTGFGNLSDRVYSTFTEENRAGKVRGQHLQHWPRVHWETHAWISGSFLSPSQTISILLVKRASTMQSWMVVMTNEGRRTKDYKKK